MRHQLRAIAVISAISCGLAVLQASSSMGRVPLGDQASVTEKRRAQEMSLGHTLEAVARARAAGRPDILASPWDRVVRDEHANIIEAGGPATWTEQIVRSTCAAQVVLMGTAVDREPFLTEDAQFILSDYTIRIDTMLRGDLKASGNSVSYVRPGGAVMVKDRLVTARHARYPALEQGRSHIVFARHTDVGLTVQRSDRWVLDALLAAPVVRAVGLDAVKALQSGVDFDVVLDAIKKAPCGVGRGRLLGACYNAR